MGEGSVQTDPVRVPALEAREIEATLGGRAILRGVSLAVAAGEIVGILGPSGAGKTTLFRILAGELRPHEGIVLLHGQDVSRLPLWARARCGLGYQPQTPSVLFDLTVRENIRTFERAAGVARGNVEEQARQLQLEHRLDVRARELSGGERRRLEVLRALTAQPSVLLCDEPFAGVDPVKVSDMVALLRAQARAGSAVVVADHRVADALSMCDRAALMVDGRIELTVEASTFAAHSLVKERYLG